MLYILTQTTRFDAIAVVMDSLDFDLRDVRSCTFPSRPEPREATWYRGAIPAFEYGYEPDLEVRFVRALATPETIALPSDFEFVNYCEEASSAELFERWSNLREQLLDGDHPTAQRAAAAWRIRGAQARADATALEVLTSALDAPSIHARRAAAAQLAAWAPAQAASALARAKEDRDLDVRLHAHRGYERAALASFKR